MILYPMLMISVDIKM